MSEARPLLYTYRRCPYAMRARMGLLLGGVAFDAHEIVLRDKPTAMLKASPKGTVPVLVWPEGHVLEESWDIVAWALTRDQASERARDWWTRAQHPLNQELLRRTDGAFKHHLDRYKYPARFRSPDGDGAAIDPAQHRREAVSVLLAPLEARLTEQPFLGGDAPCATDFGVFPFVRQFAAVDRGWFDEQALPKVQAWLAHWSQHPLFEGCMIKLPSQRTLPMPFGLATMADA